MLESLVILDCCLIALTKSRKLFNFDILIEFFEPWHRVDKYTKEIFICLQKNSPLFDNNLYLDLPFQTKQKATFQALYNSKKQKKIDDPLVAKKAQMISL